MQTYKHIYVIECKSEIPVYKVGYAYNVNQRLKELQTGCPYPLEIVKAIRAFDAPRVEAELHQALDEYRMAGEWFNAPLEVILSRVDEYSDNFSFYYWMYVFSRLGIEYRVIDDSSIRLTKDNVICSFFDFEPSDKEMIEMADNSSASQITNVVIASLPYVIKKRIGYQSSIFVRVFAGSFLDVFPVSICDMDFSKHSRLKMHDRYGRYRFFRRACFVNDNGNLKIKASESDITKEFYDICAEVMSYNTSEIRDVWDNL